MYLYVQVCTDVYSTFPLIGVDTGFRGLHRDAAMQPPSADYASMEKGVCLPTQPMRMAGVAATSVNVYEVNHGFWMFGCCKPHLGGLSVAETAVRKSARHEEQVKRAVETRRRRRAAKASSK